MMDSNILKGLIKEIDLKQQKIVAQRFDPRLKHIQKLEEELSEGNIFLEQLNNLRSKVVDYNNTLRKKISKAKEVASKNKLLTDF